MLLNLREINRHVNLLLCAVCIFKITVIYYRYFILIIFLNIQVFVVD